jgi:hypothetical protein
MSGVVKISKMRTSKRVWLGSLTMAAALSVAGCGSLANLNGAKASGADPTSAAEQQTSSQVGTPYSQPLMATGGDLAMVRPSRAVAGTSLAC